MKSEVDRKEAAIKNLLDTGNDMLKNTTSGLANVNELAKNMININTKWSNLNKRIDSKNRLFSQLAENINELRRMLIIIIIFFSLFTFLFNHFHLHLELLHQENTWLNKVQEKLNSSKLGADAEELSEELDVSCGLINSHLEIIFLISFFF